MSAPSGRPGDVSRLPHTVSRPRRVAWERTPEQLRRAVEASVGPVHSATSASAGVNAYLALTLDVPSTRVFLKAMPRAHRAAYTLANEARIAPGVAGISPRVLHHGTTSTWTFLVYEHVEGRHADLSADSTDLEALAGVMRRLCAAAGHDTSASTPLQDRWARFGTDLDLGLLAGDRLVHTDLNSGNILVGEDGTARLVDWALPARAAPWLNLGFLLAGLIDAGAAPAGAERWAADTFPEWLAAGEAAVDTFVAALARRRAERAASCPVRRRAERRAQALAARRWLRAHRGD
ncbi:hypothetical protein AB0O07_19225 [Streptomyces sp. NPDC093085]|uniref:hypothetical protein n=1 Tax=Streptomyces sp. NPDC093085 TaxID=3155068 RepID=UPI0034281C3F